MTWPRSDAVVSAIWAPAAPLEHENSRPTARNGLAVDCGEGWWLAAACIHYGPAHQPEHGSPLIGAQQRKAGLASGLFAVCVRCAIRQTSLHCKALGQVPRHV